jgi:RNA polymerase sigma factor (sigma-70 family)
MRSDEDLMAAYLAGDQRAFEALFRRYTPVLIRYFNRVGKRIEDSRDLAQQTFLKLHRSRANFRAGELVRPWLFTIARNALLDHARRRVRRPEHFTEVDAHEAPETTATPGLSEAERARALFDAMSQLSSKDRALITTHWFDEHSFEEIAAQSGMQSATLRVRAHRACARMKAWIDPVHATA